MLRSHGNFTRDFRYLEDAAELNLLLLRRRLHGGEDARALSGESPNFSLQVQLTVREIVSLICRLVGAAPPIGIAGPVEIPDMRLDSSRARTLLGWRPATPLCPGCFAPSTPFGRSSPARWRPATQPCPAPPAWRWGAERGGPSFGSHGLGSRRPVTRNGARGASMVRSS